MFFLTSPTFQNFLAQHGNNPLEVFWFLFNNGGFFITGIIIIVFSITGWQQYVRERCKLTRKYLVLQMNIPRENEQSTKAVEKIFVQLQGAANTPTFTERWWDGWLQEAFSFEIASVAGQTRYYVHLVDYYRDLVESAIYAQYPDAEIFEVEDYTKDITTQMIEKKEIQVWGAEMQLTKKDWVPIRSYERFEHMLNGVFVDPMASVLEVMSRVEPGEQFWYQIIIIPMHPKDEQKFRNDGNKNILTISNREKLYGQSYAPKRNVADVVTDAPIKALEMAGDQIFGSLMGEGATQQAQIDKSLFLVEPERDLVKAIDTKVSNVVHRAKIRFLYVAKKEMFQEFKGRRAMLGALFQYNGPNYLEPGPITQTNLQNYPFYGCEYIFPKYRLKRREIKILRRFKTRDWQRGENYGRVFGVDELASLYHFPVLEVRAPFVTKSGAKRVEPPYQLNTQFQEEFPRAAEQPEEPQEMEIPQPLPQEVMRNLPVSAGQPPSGQTKAPPKGTPPPNLPFA